MKTLEAILIEGRWQAAEAVGSFSAKNPATGQALAGEYPVSGWRDCERALAAAAQAQVALRAIDGEQRAVFLEGYATAIEARAAELVEVANLETALAASPRLSAVELPRTTTQLRQAAQAARDGSWMQAVIDSKLNIRSYFAAIGPVVVFGPNNFPYAFNGIAGGDFAAAIVHAAGDVMLDEPVGDGGALRGDLTPDRRGEGEDGILNRLAAADRWDAVCEALMELPPRERFILIARYLLDRKWKLDRLSDTLKMSRERIRQIATDGLTRIQRRIGSADVSHDPARHHAVAQAQQLINAIEHASVSSDPAIMAALFRDQQIATGPTRITQRRPATIAINPITCFLSAPALTPALQLSAA